MNAFLEKLIKAGGEGTRGGKVIGHTASGKPIYDADQHAAGARKQYPAQEKTVTPDKSVSLAQQNQSFMPAEGTEHHYADSPNLRAYKNILRAFKARGVPFQGHITYDPKTDSVKTMSGEGMKVIKEIISDYQAKNKPKAK